MNYDGGAALSLKFKRSVTMDLVYTSILNLFQDTLNVANAVDLFDSSNQLTKKILYQVLCSIPSARKISLRFNESMNGEEECLEAFIRPFPSDVAARGEKTPCPKLEHLFFWCPYKGKTDGFFSYLEQAVKARSEKGLQIHKLELQRCVRNARELSVIRRWVKDLEFIIGWTHDHRGSDSE